MYCKAAFLQINILKHNDSRTPLIRHLLTGGVVGLSEYI